MSEELEGMVAIGWSLYRAPRTAASGKQMRMRHCRIMIVEEYLITSLGTSSQSPRISVEKFTSARLARAKAVETTQRMERRGYVLSRGPVQLTTKAGKREYLDAKVGDPRVDPDLNITISHLLTKGTKLDAQPDEAA